MQGGCVCGAFAVIERLRCRVVNSTRVGQCTARLAAGQNAWRNGPEDAGHRGLRIPMMKGAAGWTGPHRDFLIALDVHLDGNTASAASGSPSAKPQPLRRACLTNLERSAKAGPLRLDQRRLPAHAIRSVVDWPHRLPLWPAARSLAPNTFKGSEICRFDGSTPAPGLRCFRV